MKRSADITALVEQMNRQAEENVRRMNADIDRYGVAFHVRDSRGNDFVFSHIAHGGFPIYRGNDGVADKWIAGLSGYEVIEKYATV